MRGDLFSGGGLLATADPYRPVGDVIIHEQAQLEGGVEDLVAAEDNTGVVQQTAIVAHLGEKFGRVCRRGGRLVHCEA